LPVISTISAVWRNLSRIAVAEEACPFWVAYSGTAIWHRRIRRAIGRANAGRDWIMEKTSLCVACTYYGVELLSLSPDPACRSKDEADRLCVKHRARCTEGMCVLCGRREPWASPWEGSDIGACELCYRVLYGNAEGDRVAAEFARRGRAA
jgi:hypothetical protein